VQCPSCHSDTADSSRFCEACGVALFARCSSCGAEIRPGARFCSNCGKKIESGTTPGPALAPPARVTASAERRHITVMFCDLVGSTELSARLDPEDMREIIGAYHRCCAEEITQAGGFVAKYLGDGILAYFRDYRTAGALANEEAALAREKGSLYHEAIGMLHQSSILAATGDPPTAIQLFNGGAAALRSTGSTLWLPFWLAFAALAYARSQRFDDAWRCIGQATTMAETTGERRFEAEIQRVAGEIALLMPDFARAETHFARAITLASDQKANSWKLRASTSLARLWRDQGKRTEARDLLAPIYGWFTEGFDTPDLKDAKALLEELG